MGWFSSKEKNTAYTDEYIYASQNKHIAEALERDANNLLNSFNYNRMDYIQKLKILNDLKPKLEGRLNSLKGFTDYQMPVKKVISNVYNELYAKQDGNLSYYDVVQDFVNKRSDASKEIILVEKRLRKQLDENRELLLSFLKTIDPKNTNKAQLLKDKSSNNGLFSALLVIGIGASLIGTSMMDKSHEEEQKLKHKNKQVSDSTHLNQDHRITHK